MTDGRARACSKPSRVPGRWETIQPASGGGLPFLGPGFKNTAVFPGSPVREDAQNRTRRLRGLQDRKSAVTPGIRKFFVVGAGLFASFPGKTESCDP